MFILVGLLLAGFGGISVVAGFSAGSPMLAPAIVFEFFLAIIGVLSLIHGIRTLGNLGKT
ncbi:MAG: hypothetical protein HY289_15130 [Planctomycetes bacterium]|nr:hypothetical protein [Planctomycetota bacterium]